MTPRSLLFLVAALVAFAANSWICRAALRSFSIDPVSFTALRLIAGAVALGACTYVVERRSRSASKPASTSDGGSRGSAAALLAYALLFSLAYLRLDAGVGALVLFGAVQITMLVASFRERRPEPREWVAIAFAVAGLLVLTLPGAGSAPSLLAALSMLGAGVAWGIYSLRGREAGRLGRSPIAENAGNFTRTVPVAALLLGAVLIVGQVEIGLRGFLLALLSGAVTSGLGYAVWYAALPALNAATAGLVQLAVPVLAALGGVFLLGERLGGRLAVASLLVLGGIALALLPAAWVDRLLPRALRSARRPRFGPPDSAVNP